MGGAGRLDLVVVSCGEGPSRKGLGVEFSFINITGFGVPKAYL